MKKLKIILQSKYVFILLFLALINSFYNNITFKSKYNNENIIYGYIIRYTINGNKLSLYLNEKEKVLCNYYFDTIDELNTFKATYNFGDYIKLEGTLKLPNNNTVFNNFNYKTYLKYEGIYYIFNINKIYKLKDNDKIRYKIKNIVNNFLESKDNKDYLYTFILGDTMYIDSEVLESYRVNGISHLFGISSINIYLISFLIFKFFKKYNFLVIFITLFYIFLTDYDLAVIRAGILFILLFINKKLNLNISTTNIMIILLSICLFIDPFIIYKIGFQYSYLISFTLLHFAEIINRENNKIKKIFITSFISFIVSIPITINNFYQLNFISIILNIFFIPLISSILFPLTLLSAFIPIFFLNDLVNFIEQLSLFISKIDLFVLVLSKINYIVVIIYYLIIYYVLYNMKLKKYSSVLLLVLLILIHSTHIYFNKDLLVTFIDVGQGDSIHIRLNNKNILIDTGGIYNYNNEKWKEVNSSYSLVNQTITYLKSIGTKKLDYLIISHADFDHMGESFNLINKYKVENVILNCGNYNNLENELIKLLEDKDIKYYSCINNLDIENNKLYFLNNNIYDNENDNSNVIYFNYNNYKFLFMGDAGIEVEKYLIDEYNLNNIDVLKVGHHGSKTSSSEEFINEINPKYSIISVGKNNRYGHPNKEVLNTLQDSKIYRTDQDGSIMFKIKNNKLKIETCAP